MFMLRPVEIADHSTSVSVEHTIKFKIEFKYARTLHPV